MKPKLLTQNRKIDWNKPANLIPLHVAVTEFAPHASVLAKMTGLTVGQVYYRLHQHGVSLRDLRDCKYGRGAEIKAHFTVSNPKIKVMVPLMRETRETYDEVHRKGLSHANTKKKKSKTA